MTVLANAAAAPPGLGDVFVSEVLGTAVLILLGGGVCAAVTLPRSKAQNSGWIVIAFGWGLAVYCGVWVAWLSGAHLNPAVTIGLLAKGAAEYAPMVPITPASTLTYLAGQMLGGFLGAVACFLVYKKHFDEPTEPGVKLGVFSTGPAIRSYGWNLLTEIVATFVLVYVILAFGQTPTQLGPLAVALLVVAIGLSLGGPTGYAINPARDLPPRIAHAVLPIKGKGDSDWAYAWVPIVGPLVGGALAGLAAAVLIPA
ncbi:MIP/aquaporin family protein [Mobilicoccus massiliensis]|uniref:MIP/aquaporin family protein n=1 Tax=Mobilicoccus massiliensis TaxID=1522310 RepID=UPI000AAFD615|nr:MIP/aquaporin family protein [Mobilicoccus massiliensis]